MYDEKRDEDQKDDNSIGPVPPGSPDITPVKEPDASNKKVRDPALPDQDKTRLK